MRWRWCVLVCALADDPRIRDTVKVIDALLKVETPIGATWHRYNDDGYGEHEDGSPFDGTGIGRGWPLLTGERAHYELAAGQVENANGLLTALESFANDGGLIPEQVWDTPDIPEHELYFGRPSGSAMPLVWAHAEYLKLMTLTARWTAFRSAAANRKTLSEGKNHFPAHDVEVQSQDCAQCLPGKILRIELMAPAVVHWTADDWKTCKDM